MGKSYITEENQIIIILKFLLNIILYVPSVVIVRGRQGA